MCTNKKQSQYEKRIYYYYTCRVYFLVLKQIKMNHTIDGNKKKSLFQVLCISTTPEAFPIVLDVPGEV